MLYLFESKRLVHHFTTNKSELGIHWLLKQTSYFKIQNRFKANLFTEQICK